MALTAAAGGSSAPGSPLGGSSTRLLLDATTTAQPPIYATLMTASLLTELVASDLLIRWTGDVIHTGPSTGNAAPNIRFLINGVVVTPGGGTTANQVRSRIMPLSYSLVYPVVAGVQTVDVEWAYFGPAGQTIAISPVSLSDLMHAQLTLQELRP